jgi:hypothetical protein
MGDNKISFEIKGIDAEGFYQLISGTKVSQLHAEKGVPFMVWQLLQSLEDCQQSPDDDEEYPENSAARLGYCNEHDLTLSYFPKEVEWVIERRLLQILKLILRAAMEMQSGGTVGGLFGMCETVRLAGWFKKTFEKKVHITLEDDCDLDDEIEDEDEDEKKEDGEAKAEAAD